MAKFRIQFDDKPALSSPEKIIGESPVVNGQALTNAELFRKISNGLPVGCAINSFNKVDPRLEKLSVMDSLHEYRIKHGMYDSKTIEVLLPENIIQPQEAPIEEPPAQEPPSAD